MIKSSAKIARWFLLFACSLLIIACTSSNVYRIETTSGLTVYSKDKPKLNKDTGYYELIDLDGSQMQIKDSLLFKIEPYIQPK